MDLRALRYFVAVVRLASFTRAAEQLFVTQPTISKMIRSLEDSLGEPLLVRDGRQIRPTAAGSIVLEHAERMLREASHLHEDLAGLRGLTHGQLCLGIPPMVGPLVVPLLASFRARHPGIQPRFTESGGLALEAAVSRGEVDLAISVLPVSDDSLAVAPMADYPLWAVLPAGSPPVPSPLPLAALHEQPFVLYEDDFVLTGRILAACRQRGFVPAVAGQSRHWDFIGELVAAGTGVALLPSPVASRLDPARVRCVELDEPDLRWRLGWVWREALLDHASRAWLEHVGARPQERPPEAPQPARQ